MVATSARSVHTPLIDTAVEMKPASVASSPAPTLSQYNTGKASRSIVALDDPMMSAIGKLPIDEDFDRMLIGSDTSRTSHVVRQRPRSTSLVFDLPTLFPNSLGKYPVERRRTSMTFVLPESESMWRVPTTPSSISWSAAARSDRPVEPLAASCLPIANPHPNLASTPDLTSSPVDGSPPPASTYSSALSSMQTTPPSKQFRSSSRRPSGSAEGGGGGGLQSRQRSIRSFNARLNSFAQKGNYNEVLALIDSTQRGEVELASPLNTYSYTILVKAYCNAGNIVAAETLVHEMNGLAPSQRPNRFTYNILLNACVRLDDMHRASTLFKIMENSSDESLRPDHVTFTTLMKGYAAQGDMMAAHALLTRLLHHPDPLYRPNHVTYNTMLKGFAANGDLDGAERLLQQMYDQPACQPDLVSLNTIIGGYCRINDMVNAERLFAPMLKGGDASAIVPNAVTFQAMIEGYIRDHNSVEVDKLMREVEERFGKEAASHSIGAAIGRAAVMSDPILSDLFAKPPPAAQIDHDEPADPIEPIEPAESAAAAV